MAYIKAATLDRIKPGKALEVEVDGELIGLFNVNGTIHAASSVCPHAGGPLCDGNLQENTITCPLHGWQFEVDTGRCLRIPAMKLKTYEVKIEGNDILISVTSG